MISGALLLLSLSIACSTEEVDPTAPPAPSVDPLDPLTRDNPIMVEGEGEPGATVQVRGGANPVATGPVTSTGRFSVQVQLKPNTLNELLVSQIRDGVEGPGEELEITHDSMAPLTPELDQVPSPTRRTRVTISGTAEAGAAVAVTGGLEEASGEVDAEGRFSIEVALMTEIADITQNDLMVVATDLVGNASSPALVTIVHNPNLPIEAPELDPLPEATNSTTIAVSGSTEPGITISIAGGAETAEASADASGEFTVDVYLRPNSINVLSAFAIIPVTGLSSPARIVRIEHDDVAPDAPSLDPVGSPTGATIVRLSGTAEAGADILISGGVAAVSSTTALDGRFTADVELMADSLNTLEVKARDAAGNEGPAATVSIEQDSTLEEPVSVDAIPSPTAQNPITISGRAEPDAVVEISGGTSTATAVADANGGFSAEVDLTPNATNTLHVFRTGSTVETVVVVVHDNRPPEAPMLDALASPTNQTIIVVSGTSEPSANISITGGDAPASGVSGAAGRFSVQVSIPADTTTTLSVISTDRAGNSSPPSMVTVTHSSEAQDAPLIDEPTPDPTNEPTYVLTGRVSAPAAGITVRISGGASPATGPTDPSTGAFAVEVTLNANASNELEVVAIEGAIESPPALVTILHDDMAPAAPDGTRISIGSPSFTCVAGPLGSISVTGGAMAVEAFARVGILNLTRTNLQASTDAAQDGAFSASIQACEGDVLRITATDAAGNVSPATEMTVE